MNKKSKLYPPQLFNVQQAAEFLGVNPGTIRRWVHTHQIKGIKVGLRGDWRFKKEDLLTMIKEHEEKPALALNPVSNFSQLSDTTHVAQFYENDTFLINSIKEYIHAGDVAIIIATKEHRKKLEKILTGNERGQYIYLDAAETLAKFMDNDMPDPERFFKVIGVLISQIGKDREHVRAYGEMVALLWAQGNHKGAIRLEALWNDLQKILPFSLFCSYPMSELGGEHQVIPFTEVCVQHSGVLPSEGYGVNDKADDRLRIIAALQQKAKSLEQEIERRKKLESQKDEFMAVVSHELRTPVTSLKAFTQVLQNRFEKAGNKEAAKHLTKMDAQINKLTVLIGDLLDTTKIESGKLRFLEADFSFDELVAEVIEEVQRTTTKHKIILKDVTNQQVYGDRDRIGQVITNLLTNAIKYSPNADKVLVKTAVKNGEVLLSVKDFGRGISKKEQPFVFDRFYRVTGADQETFPGLGLGLYISSQIIKRHQGRIWVESAAGSGSTFSFLLPLKKKHI